MLHRFVTLLAVLVSYLLTGQAPLHLSMVPPSLQHGNPIQHQLQQDNITFCQRQLNNPPTPLDTGDVCLGVDKDTSVTSCPPGLLCFSANDMIEECRLAPDGTDDGLLPALIYLNVDKKHWIPFINTTL